ncbi:FadR/GntR family transcriptional regulator [Kitasatospora viridis]|uniref:GntR family transcriptional regulator n=1 Tax=Kitasatospora viridis TaxID=281105 RepID=A0A561TSG8_9ACTN|nr:FCD domain-containing protein [Kitasatospora viridis]TWF90049.1 GntR family transcriptional regulator [Kitasatospora viridis]
MTGSEKSSATSAEAAGAYRPGYEVAAERILEYVVRSGLQPGARLPTEKDLADEVQMSRTVVREAVKILSALGRLSVQKGRGIYVAEPEPPSWQQSVANFLPADLQQVDELFEFRRYLETISANLAAQRARPAQVKAVREAAQQSAQAAEQGDIEAFTAADDAFHIGVATAAGNMFIASTVEAVRRLQRQVATIGLTGVAAGSLTAAAEQHAAIAEAVAAGEPDQAEALMAEHVELTTRQFQQEIWRRVIPGSESAS